MWHSRRVAIQRGGVIAACMAWASQVPAWAGVAESGSGFEMTTLGEVLNVWGTRPVAGTDVVLTVPDLAENGAMVPVSVSSSLPGVQEIAIVVDSNPYPLVVRFSIPEQTEAFVSTRVRMAQSGAVYAVVLAQGKLYAVSKATKVTVGGCGG